MKQTDAFGAANRLASRRRRRHCTLNNEIGFRLARHCRQSLCERLRHGQPLLSLAASASASAGREAATAATAAVATGRSRVNKSAHNRRPPRVDNRRRRSLDVRHCFVLSRALVRVLAAPAVAARYVAPEALKLAHVTARKYTYFAPWFVSSVLWREETRMMGGRVLPLLLPPLSASAVAVAAPGLTCVMRCSTHVDYELDGQHLQICRLWWPIITVRGALANF